uniref:Uncharacterized protein n=1 Tax=viral metagenome TaxID=1070528 RepID=A0A6C0HFU3_9ZZZZ
MALNSEFQSRKNKETLWKFMMDNNFFDGISPTYSNDIKAYFDKKVTHLSTTILPTDSLVILNKQVISDMMANNFKYKEMPQQQEQKIQTIPPLIITAGDITEQRQKVFNKVLETKQSEFNSLMNKNVPDKIDFSDKADKPLGSEMEQMIADTIKWREKELNVVLQSQDQTEATKWINRDQATQQTAQQQSPAQQQTQAQQQQKHVEKTKFIKIGQSTTLDNIVDLKKTDKHVSFDFGGSPPWPPERATDRIVGGFAQPLHMPATNTVDDDFLSMLKQKPDAVEEIKTMLIEILQNQKVLLNLMGA